MKIEISIVARGTSDRIVVLDNVQSYAEDPRTKKNYLWFEFEDKAIKASAILDFIYGKPFEDSEDIFEQLADSVYRIERLGDMLILSSERYQISERP